MGAQIMQDAGLDPLKVKDPLGPMFVPKNVGQAPSQAPIRVYDATGNNWHEFPPGTTLMAQKEAIANFNKEAGKKRAIMSSLGFLDNMMGQYAQTQQPSIVPSKGMAFAMGSNNLHNLMQTNVDERQNALIAKQHEQNYQLQLADHAAQQRHWNAQLAEAQQRQQELDAWRQEQLAQHKEAQQALETQRDVVNKAREQGQDSANLKWLMKFNEDQLKNAHKSGLDSTLDENRKITGGLNLVKNGMPTDAAEQVVGLPPGSLTGTNAKFDSAMATQAYNLAFRASQMQGSPYYIRNATNEQLVAAAQERAKQFMAIPGWTPDKGLPVMAEDGTMQTLQLDASNGGPVADLPQELLQGNVPIHGTPQTPQEAQPATPEEQLTQLKHGARIEGLSLQRLKPYEDAEKASFGQWKSLKDEYTPSSKNGYQAPSKEEQEYLDTAWSRYQAQKAVVDQAHNQLFGTPLPSPKQQKSKSEDSPTIIDFTTKAPK